MINKYIKKFKSFSLNRLYQYNIYKRLIMSFILGFVLPILLIGGYNAMYSFLKNEKEARLFLEESSVQIADNISYYIYYHMDLLEEVATNPAIIEDLTIYEQADWKRKSEIENHIRLVLGHTFGVSDAIDTCELITLKNSYFYYPSPVSNGNFATSELLYSNNRKVNMTVGNKEIPSDRNNYVILSRGIFSYKNQCVGNIAAALDLTYFNEACYKNVTNLLNEVLIINENNVIISGSDEQQIGSSFISDRLRSVSVSKSIPDTNLTIVNRIAMQTLFKSAFIQFFITLLTALVFATLACFMAVLFTKSITGPIKRLMEEMNKEKVDKFVEDTGDDEYHMVIDGFNKMNGHIVDAVQGQYKMKLQETELRELRKEAELSALQQQINPHFLYNTLESIYWSCQFEGDEEISEIVNALGNYLRVIIDNGLEYVTIEDEIESVNNYIFLQNKRFGGRITNKWDVPMILKDTKITKLAIHPIVEDIIAVNLDEIEEQISTSISIKNDEDNIIVIMTGQAVEYFLCLANKAESELRGINSVDERLTLYYGDGFGVVLDEERKEIRVAMPVFPNEESRGEQYG